MNLATFLVKEGLFGDCLRRAMTRGHSRTGLIQLWETWEVRPTTALGMFGQVWYKERRMLITSLDCSPEKREDTIRHELAHVMAKHAEDHTDHGHPWRHWATILGADPTSAGSDQRFTAASREKRARSTKRVAVCGGCGYEWFRMRRSQHWNGRTHKRCGGEVTAI